ncbi:MAG: MFS transporter [Clostridia bacterium]
MFKKNDNIAVFYILAAAYWFSVYTYVSVLPNHAQDLGATKSIIGLISGSYGFTQMILRMPLGILSDRLKRRRLFVGAGLVISCISSIGLALSTTPMQLLLFRGLAGVAVSTWVVFPSYLTETYHLKNGHKAMGILLAITQIGRMIATAIGGASADFFGIRWGYLTGVVAAGLGLLLFLSLPGDSYEDKTAKVPIKELLGVIRSRNLRYSSFLAILFQFTNFATVMTFTPLYARGIGMTDSSIGLMVSLFTLTGAVSAFISGTVFKKYLGARKTIAVAFLGSGLMVLAIPFISTAPMLVATQAINGFFMGVTLPLLMSQSLLGVCSEKKSSAMGYFQAIYGVGMFSGPYLTGLIAEGLGLAYGFYTVFLVCMLGAGVSMIYLYTDKMRGRMVQDEAETCQF